MVMERLIQEGVRTYDFLGGVSQHKLSWGGVVRESARLTVRGSGLRATVVAGLTRLAETTAPIRAALRRSPA
jgi:CelD/BcsL family acetyltransferase involved in cellulose biosynthesis